MLKFYDTKDAVPEAMRESAVETKDGKFAVSEEEDTAPLRTKFEEAERKRDAAEKLAKKSAKELADLQAKGKFDGDQLKQVEDEVARRVAEQTEKFADYDAKTAKVRELTLDAQVMGLYAAAGFKPERMGAVRKQFLDEYDIDDAGKAIVKGNKLADVKRQVEDHKKAFPEWVLPSGANGGGASGGGGGAGGGNGGLTLEQVMANPGRAIEAGNAK